MALDPIAKVKAKVPPRPATTWTITYANGQDGLMVAEKMDVLAGGTIGFYAKPADASPFLVMSPTSYRTIKRNA